MSERKPENFMEVLTRSLGQGLGYVAQNYQSSQDQKKNDAMTAFAAALQMQQSERAQLEHNQNMIRLRIANKSSSERLKETIRRGAMTPEERAIEDAQAEAAGKVASMDIIIPAISQTQEEYPGLDLNIGGISTNRELPVEPELAKAWAENMYIPDEQGQSTGEPLANFPDIAPQILFERASMGDKPAENMLLLLAREKQNQRTIASRKYAERKGEETAIKTNTFLSKSKGKSDFSEKELKRMYISEKRAMESRNRKIEEQNREAIKNIALLKAADAKANALYIEGWQAKIQPLEKMPPLEKWTETFMESFEDEQIRDIKNMATEELLREAF